jgi:hypothetical protein
MKHILTLALVVFYVCADFNKTLAQIVCTDYNGTPCEPNDTEISLSPDAQTPNSTFVSVFKWDNWADKTNCVLKKYQTYMSDIFPNVTLLSCPDYEYNCHGYAWHMEFYGFRYPNEYGQKLCIRSEQIYKYWNDGSFYQVNFIPQNIKGVVVYPNNAHSAVTVPGSNPMKFRSKWGQGYLVEHLPTATPYGTPERYYLRCGACDAAPYLDGITYNWGTANTVNFVSAGGYNVSSNLHPTCELNQDVCWNWQSGSCASNSGSNWGVSGSRNINAWFNLSSGQSITFSVKATSPCGTANRYVTFVAQSYYRMANTNGIKDRLEIEFDNVDYLEILPQQIVIFDEKTGKEEVRVSMKEIFESKQFGVQDISYTRFSCCFYERNL